MSRWMKLAAVVLVLLAAVLVALALRSSKKPAPAAVARAAPATAVQQWPVVLAKRDLKAGMALGADDLEVTQWPAVPEQVFSDLSGLTGKVLRFDLKKSQPVLREFIAEGLSTHLGKDERAVTVAIDAISGAGQQVSPGDWVDVFFTLGKGAEVKDTQARLLLPKVRVLAYGRQSLSGEQVDEAERGAARKPEPARSAVLAVPLDEVNALLLAARSGSLQFVLRSVQDEGMPARELFPDYAAVLHAKQDLTEAQKQQLQEPGNVALAGLGLREMAHSKDGPVGPAPAAATAERRQGAGRTVEVIRGGRKEQVPY